MLESNKHILVIDAILILGSLIIIGGLVGYATPLVIAPIDDYTTSNTSVLFTFQKADVILIDDNLEFSSPEEIYVRDNAIINLEPGVYYWKVVGTLESEVRQFTIESVVDLKIRQSGRGDYEVVNSGNNPLSVDVYDSGVLTGKITLDVDESGTALGDKFIGGAS